MDSTPRFGSTKAQPARRSESREEPRDSWAGTDVERCAELRKLLPRDGGRNAGAACEMGKCRMRVMAYIGLLRGWEA
jgi:hypothetical protein